MVDWIQNNIWITIGILIFLLGIISLGFLRARRNRRVYRRRAAPLGPLSKSSAPLSTPPPAMTNDEEELVVAYAIPRAEGLPFPDPPEATDEDPGDQDFPVDRDESEVNQPVSPYDPGASPGPSGVQTCTRTIPERVGFSAFAPRNILPGASFILDIWAYLTSDYQDAVHKAREVGRGISVGRKTGVQVSRGTILTIKIDIPLLRIPHPLDTLIWDGEPANASYIIEIDDSSPSGTYPGWATITSGGMLIATLSFLIRVDSVEDDRRYEDCSDGKKYIKTAFASYASEDREEVVSRIHGMMKIAPSLDIFFDVFSLRSGEKWQDRIEEHVPAKDIFFLFWSHYAAKSLWVEREWRLALDKRGLDYIDPVPLENPDEVPPPPELSRLHFGDAFVAYIQCQRSRRQILET